MAAKFRNAPQTYQTPLRAPFPRAVSSSGQFSAPAQIPVPPGSDPGRINDFLDGVRQKNLPGHGDALKSTALIMGAAIGWTAYRRFRGARKP